MVNNKVCSGHGGPKPSPGRALGHPIPGARPRPKDRGRQKKKLSQPSPFLPCLHTFAVAKVCKQGLPRGRGGLKIPTKNPEIPGQISRD